MPGEILALIKEKKLLRSELRKTNNPQTRTDYNKLNKEVKNKIKEFSNNKWEQIIIKSSKTQSSKPLWNGINKFRKGKASSNIPPLRYEDKTVENACEKAEIFAHILGKTFNMNTNCVPTEEIDNSLKEKENPNFGPLTGELFNLEDLKQSIKTLKAGSPGDDGIHNLMIKNCSDNFLSVLLKLFNICISQGKIPDQWKVSKISMIPKKQGYSNNPSEYRPISLLSCLGKLFEKLLHDRIYSFIESKKIFNNCQSGFRKYRSCKDHLLFLTQKIKESFARKKKVLSLFFDICKAFDCVWHDGLIYKLYRIGLPDYLVNIVRNYLSNRYFFVEVDGERSQKRSVGNGVPQGSVLGPLLFIIFINDMPTLNEKNKSYSMLYADDLTCIFIYKKPGQMLALLKRYLFRLESWFKTWKFKVSISKCCYTIFSNGKKEKFNIRFMNENLKYEESPTLLGVTFDQSLCFKNQVDIIRWKCFNRLNLIKILSNQKWKLTTRTLITLYKSLIGSIIDYSSFMVHELSVTNLKRVQSLQNRAMRTIFRKSFDTPTSELCLVSGMKTIKDRLVDLNKKFIAKARLFNSWIFQLVEEFEYSKNAFRNVQTTISFYT